MKVINPNPVLEVLKQYNERIVADGIVGDEGRSGVARFDQLLPHAGPREVNEMIEALIKSGAGPYGLKADGDWGEMAQESWLRFKEASGIRS